MENVHRAGTSWQLYSVLLEKQTSNFGLMGPERGYDISGVVSASLPAFGEERVSYQANQAAWTFSSELNVHTS